MTEQLAAVEAYTRGGVAEEQMAALARAVLLDGMCVAETARSTPAMIAARSGAPVPPTAVPLVHERVSG